MKATGEAEPPNFSPPYRVLALDGGGIKGTFSASVLADFEEAVGEPLVNYFDLIAGTSTGGIIALGLGLGLTANEIVNFYETHGPAIFARPRGTVGGLLGAKYDAEPLREALQDVFGDRLLGEANTRLVVPATNLDTGDVHVFKTAHHARFERDYQARAVDGRDGDRGRPDLFPYSPPPCGHAAHRWWSLGEQPHGRRSR